MPTENRSSNTEMVSVPERLEAPEMSTGHPDAGQAYATAFYKERARADALAALLAQPAEQHQVELVALPERKKPRNSTNADWYGAIGWNACLDEIAKLGPLYTRPTQGEPVAWVRVIDGEPMKYSWFGNKRLPVGKHQLYTHSDPGEVERCEARLHEVASLCASVEQERDTLRAQLAEAHGLLHDLAQANREYFPEEECPPQHPGLMARYAALSASAEPSAPVKRDERAEFEACIRREWPMAPISRKRDLLPKDDPCFGDYCDEPLQRAWVGWQMRAALERKP